MLYFSRLAMVSDIIVGYNSALSHVNAQAASLECSECNEVRDFQEQTNPSSAVSKEPDFTFAEPNIVY